MPSVETREDVVIRFAGDSGDGIQLLGSQFTSTTARLGNDLATFPDYPAEIRAPAGTPAGVSGFQLQFSARDIATPGDAPDALVAMNPAALKVNLGDLRRGGLVIVNAEKFVPRELEKAGYAASPLEDDTLTDYQVIRVDMGRLTKEAVDGLGLAGKEVERCRNFFALGITYWLYSRSLEATRAWIEHKFEAPWREANLRALEAGYNYAENTEAFTSRYEIPPARLAPGRYRNLMGNHATALGLVAAAQKAGLPLFCGSYPITPATDILHHLAGYKAWGVMTFQAEDEIAAMGATIGAAYAGVLGVTTTSGPGMALKTEALGLAVMTELPLVIVNVQRGGPSTGLPTKTEQSDLLQALVGRNGEAPLPVLAAASPADCFRMAVEAVRVAVAYMTPVVLLTDGYLANGSEPWKVQKLADLPDLPVRFRTDPAGFQPYGRDPDTLARPWVRPGTPGLEHRIGGLEKADGTGNVSYDPANHDRMVRLRASKVAGVAVPDQEVFGDPDGLLVVGWGSTYGAIRTAVDQARARGHRVGHAHVRYLNPLPRNLADVLARYDRVLVPEMNLGQLSLWLRAKTGITPVPLTKVQGRMFKVQEIVDAIVRNRPEAS
ncbi:MAG: 2-oxoacid:acceptor oxidoreductase subunit alpha [Myxococcota bacterium]